MEAAPQTAELPEYVTLISSDGFEFKLRRAAACRAGAISKMLDPKSLFPIPWFITVPRPLSHVHCPKSVELSLTTRLTGNFVEAATNTCTFSEINGLVLEKVCEYLMYAEKNKDAKDVPDMDLPPELCLELLMAADFLNC